MMVGSSPAPELDIVRWFNVSEPITLAQLRGRVVALHAFQMLCPGCVQAGLPQAQRIARLFSADQVAVIGVHTVFEHHAAMTPVSLEAFIYEFRLTFPIGVDRAGEAGLIPNTMTAYDIRGTPTLVLIDRTGRIRKQTLGVEEDLRVGADIATLLTESTEGGS